MPSGKAGRPEQVAGHAGVLGTLPGAEKSDPRRPAAVAGRFLGFGCRGVAVECLGEVGAGAGRPRRYVSELLTRLLV